MCKQVVRVFFVHEKQIRRACVKEMRCTRYRDSILEGNYKYECKYTVIRIMEVPVRWHSLLQGVHSCYCVETSLPICAFVIWKPVLEQMLVCVCVCLFMAAYFCLPEELMVWYSFSEHRNVIPFSFLSAHAQDASFFELPFLVLLVGLAYG